MSTLTLTLTQPIDNMSATVLPTLNAGAVNQPLNKTVTVQWQDGSSNNIQLVGTTEMVRNFLRYIDSILKP